MMFFFIYVKLLNSKIKKNSLFVINKFDDIKNNLENKDDILKTKNLQIFDNIFRNFHTIIKKIILLFQIKKNNFIVLDSRNLKFEKNILNIFDDFILNFANKLKNNENIEDFFIQQKKK